MYAKYVKSQTAAIVLGKALFWDMQVGSDGIQACASCHFTAGIDIRSYNTSNPGTNQLTQDLKNPDPSTFFKVTAGPNDVLSIYDFPFHELSDPNNRLSTVVFDSNDIVGSQGVFKAEFRGITRGSNVDLGTVVADPIFNVGGINVRQVTPRNTPSVINAIFNYRSFWDGRAQNEFNGVSPFGKLDPSARVYQSTGTSSVAAVQIAIPNSSLASVAVGPPLNEVELSYNHRIFPLVGRKLLDLKPLAKQVIATDDSVLGAQVATGGKGLTQTYRALIQQAFQDAWWNSSATVTNGTPTAPLPAGATPTSGQYTQMEQNFSLFFGLAINAYLSTLVSDQTPYDRALPTFDVNGKAILQNPAALSTQAQQGFALFVDRDRAACLQCHGGPALSHATVPIVTTQFTDRMIEGDGLEGIYDTGFFNTGVRPTYEDIGHGGTTPSGIPLSNTRQAQQGAFFDPTQCGSLIVPADRAVVDGAFKAPALRNIELTAPYFHNGGTATLAGVVDFYNRGGDFFDQNIKNVDGDIKTGGLRLTATEKSSLVAFLKSLTDERVRFHRAPFDHPQLIIPDGQSGNATTVYNNPNFSGTALDYFVTINPVGRNGYTTPAPTFLNIQQ